MGLAGLQDGMVGCELQTELSCSPHTEPKSGKESPNSWYSETSRDWYTGDVSSSRGDNVSIAPWRMLLSSVNSLLMTGVFQEVTAGDKEMIPCSFLQLCTVQRIYTENVS